MFPPIAYLLTPLFVLLFLSRKRSFNLAILLFYFSLIFADSLLPNLQFFKNTRIECILILFLYTFQSLIKGKRVDNNILFFFPFMFCLIVGLVFSPVLTAATTRTLSYIFLAFIVFHLVKNKLIESSGQLLADILTFSSLIILAGHLLILIAPNYVITFGSGLGLRTSGVFGNPNGLGIFCFLLFPLGLYAGRTGITSSKFTRFFIGLLLVSVLASGSRAALGGIIIFGAYWFANSTGPGLRIAIKTFIPIVFLLGFTIGLQLVGQSKYLNARLRLETLETAGGRLDAWRWGYNQVSENLFFGRGLVYDSYVYQSKLSNAFRRSNRSFNAAFSGVLALLLDVGIIGMSAFLLFILLAFSRFKDRLIAFPLFLALSVSWIFESWIVASLNPFTILFLLQIVVFQTFPLQHRYYRQFG